MNKYAGVDLKEILIEFAINYCGENNNTASLAAKEFLKRRAESKSDKVNELINAVKELYPHCHESDMKGESNYERAWLRVEKALKAMESYRNQNINEGNNSKEDDRIKKTLDWCKTKKVAAYDRYQDGVNNTIEELESFLLTLKQ